MSVLNYHRNTFRLRFLVTIFLVVWINFFAFTESSEESNSLKTQVEVSENLNESEVASVDTVEECSICISPIIQKFTLKCKHLFCETCIVIWANNKLSCPLCNAELENDQNLKNLMSKINGIDEDIRRIDIFTACKNGRLDVVDLHIKNNPDLHIPVYGSELLKLALLNDHLDIITFLIQNGANIDSLFQNGESMLFTACNSNRLDHVKFLLNLRANPNILNSSNYLSMQEPKLMKSILEIYLIRH